MDTPRCAFIPAFRRKKSDLDKRRHERGANMWAEYDLGPAAPPCLESHRQPSNDSVYRMYHGTTKEAAEKIKTEGFRPSSEGMLGPGVYLSRDLEKASRYPLNVPVKDRVILMVKVNVGRVKRIDRQRHPLQKTWHDHGFDTAWCPPNCGMVPSGLEEDCVWDPQRITVIYEIRPRSLEHLMLIHLKDFDKVFN